jgi:hypothetical protein
MPAAIIYYISPGWIWNCGTSEFLFGIVGLISIDFQIRNYGTYFLEYFQIRNCDTYFRSYGTSETNSELWDLFKIRNCETYFWKHGILL